MSKRELILTVIILLTGILLRLYSTSGGQYIFHMDSARDYIEVREMVVSQKMRLIGPTSAINGFYTGPGWYYLLIIPFLLTGGDPYGSILLEIIAWTVGGFYLLKITRRFGRLPMVLSGLFWVFSDYMMLQTAYSFHPNMITLLTPLFIYLLEKYLLNPSIYTGLATFFLAGMFFQFEMNFGIYLLPIILTVILITKKWGIFKNRSFYLGLLIFLITLLPQIIFDFKHDHIMYNALRDYISTSNSSFSLVYLLNRVLIIYQSFINIFLPIYMNFKPLALIMNLALIGSWIYILRPKKITDDIAVLISFLFIIIPFIGFCLLPVSINPWHLGGVVAATIMLSAFSINLSFKIKYFGAALGWVVAGLIFYVSTISLINYIKAHNSDSHDPSLLSTEVSAIDYVYKEAEGKNFKVYTYLPSVYDYPYQYLFWWYGQKRYGYVPKEYSYLPNKPMYIPGKDKLQDTYAEEDSNLIFLIKEPDNKQRRELWENSFNQLPLLKRHQIGPLEIETREAVN